MWLSLERAGWQWSDGHLSVDDLGTEWDVRCDPPVAVMDAMLSTVRRMRLKKVAAVHPALIHTKPGVGASGRGMQEIVVDL